jgi:hypothetical protein
MMSGTRDAPLMSAQIEDAIAIRLILISTVAGGL